MSLIVSQEEEMGSGLFTHLDALEDHSHLLLRRVILVNIRVFLQDIDSS